ncbi:MAG TPA: radical SAM family heme chaperone HemW, partial [Roseiflexaceae bacterium]|nr:radical SAM family heme chaperone HemW [Roseiflexaceae bacterium]
TMPRDWQAANVKHLYIHIPFCHRRCSYCDFNTYANMDDRMAAYVEALCKEIRSWGSGIGDRIVGSHSPSPTSHLLSPNPRALVRADLKPTIFLGGGTPSMLPLPLMERVLAAANELIPLESGEVTVEANPGTVLGRDYLRELRGMGVNRLSMGVQSLHDPTLKVLGRIHTADEARASFEDARRAGFDNVNLDFIFGLPGQTLVQWRETLDTIAEWDAEHFSLYSLILEPSTPLHAQVLGGRVSVPDDDDTAEMYELAIERLDAAGYVQYEISNWAKPDFGFGVLDFGGSQDAEIQNPTSKIPNRACHHNLAYWLNADYLACGAGAHGHIYPRRFADVLGIDEYIGKVRDGQSPIAEITDLDAQDLQAETMFMGLRLNAGVGYAHFRDRCGVEMQDVYGETLAQLVDLGLLERDEIGVRLTARGRMLGNQVFERFV